MSENPDSPPGISGEMSPEKSPSGLKSTVDKDQERAILLSGTTFMKEMERVVNERAQDMERALISK